MPEKHFNQNWREWLRDAAATGIGVIVASITSGGIGFRSPLSLLLAIVAILLLNTFLRPLLVTIALPFIVMTFGLGLLVVNAVVLLLAGILVPGFFVSGLFSGLWGAFVLGLVALLWEVFVGSGSFDVRLQRGMQGSYHRDVQRWKQERLKKDEDIIDI